MQDHKKYMAIKWMINCRPDAIKKDRSGMMVLSLAERLLMFEGTHQ
jgi:hypothetical protein